MDYSNFVPVVGTVVRVNRGTECCNQIKSVREWDGEFYCSTGDAVH